MKELTVKEFAEVVKGGLFNITSIDTYGIYLSMVKAKIEYDEDNDEIVFFKPCENGSSEIRFNIDDCIEFIGVEEDGTITIEFTQYMSDVEIRKAVS